MRSEKLGLVPAIVIVWVSGFVVSLVIDNFVFRSIAVSLATGAPRSTHGYPWAAAAFLIAARALIGGLAVVCGVRLMGYDLSYPAAAFALAVGAFLSTLLAYATVLSIVSNPPEAGSVFTLLFFPLGILLGLVLPAYMIDVATMRAREGIPPGRPYHGMPSNRL